ncbi:MAG: hypothetical protein HYR96_15290 [Deltaproteobacteria bacterium]|nr:hypothetical protein [Deltaproteobacteria bacterium]MBI3296242.1 hypothetical protein [Deltaproteobacteria bacterium]
MKTVILGVALLLSGCAALNTVSLTPIPADRQHVVEATASRFIFMAFNFDNDYVDEIATRLKAKCEGGVVSGILTKDESIYYLPGFFMTHKIHAKGFCHRRS